ncbi:hypothetical protein [Adhaeribacter pallidiroseus]|uniref:Outer membrane protein beta-barrel domain-containing protein n=1 Tax=Adhaeribacter pallidiroseus TaxID=2072847 RepID=A0A369QI98_9BACT|nr:hypothetical protein [Adhaeribacter pallidiroseus]RDC64444.1 hypothetical protein AHMF7616_03058 [Adhaeribacter pallidiroseus]
MIKYISIITLLLGWGGTSWAQTAEAPAELNSTPPAIETSVIPAPAVTEAQESMVIKPVRKINYGLSMGTQFSPLFGTATYLEPSVLFPVTKRFSGFASVSMISAFNNYPNRFGQEAGVGPMANRWNQHYILHAGGNYMVNDRLNLTGSVWRDLSKNRLSAPVNLLMPGGTNGMSIRASYKVTDNFSVSGGLRYSNGNAYQNSWYNPATNFGY